jgi:hypothetical protein
MTTKQQIEKIIIKKNGQLRSTKPKVVESDPITGRAAYVWRMVSFLCSKNRKLRCMPICADFNLCKTDWENRKEICKELDQYVKEISEKFPPYGAMRWGKALGML